MITVSGKDVSIGRFYFKRTQNGNLIGEFSNNFSSSNSTESADAITRTTDFIGNYETTWGERASAVFGNLSITYKPGSGDSIYILEWTDEENNKMFIGEGFVVDNMLIGDYRDFELH